MVMTISGTGHALSPAYIFPRARFYDNLMIGLPIGNLTFWKSRFSKQRLYPPPPQTLF